MKLTVVIGALSGLATVPFVSSAPTDTLMNGDPAQSGYLPNHNMDPNIISGGSFGQIWQFKASIPQGGFQDSFYAKPLVYTPKSLGRQVVLAFSEANRIYVLDAANGTLIASRDLSSEGESPFKVSDLPNCNDIGQSIGITGTPVIDPATDTVYFWAKSYLNSGQMGWQNGAYRFHAVDATTLIERPGFPTNLQGAIADNDNTRCFTGGTHLQRASLNLINGVVFAGFGAHCDLFNYTGWVVGMSTSGKYVTGYVTMGGPGAPPQDGTYNGGGGGAGIWMAGSAIASDYSGRLFFTTGNAKAPTVNQQVPSPGRVHLSTLSESMVNLAINSQSGSLTQQDYFEPATYLSMDAGDRDLGSGGVCLPDPSVFSGGGIARLAITCGKSGDCFITNADNLGGYKMGSSGGDAIVQRLTVPGGGSIFSTVGTYPLEGGYLYVTPVGNPTYVYSLGFDTSGRPAFTLVAQTSESSPGAVGAGPATITTLNGQPGTGILWITDTNGLRAYNAVPVNGQMVRINVPALPGLFKFSRPTFGDGRYYMPTFSGSILAFGAPVALPLNCSSPIDFGSVSIGSSNTMMATCTANVAITKILGLVIEKPIFRAQNSSLPQGSLNAGDSFSFPIGFNLTGFVVSGGSTSAPSAVPGVQSTALTLFTINSVSGYSTQQGITLTGTAVSQDPYLSINPLQVTFPGIVVGSAGSNAGTTSTFLIQNLGKSNLTILGYAYRSASGSPYTNVTMSGTAGLDPNGIFTSQNLPSLGSTVMPGDSITVTATFSTSIVGNAFTILTVFSNGGSAYTILSGTASTAPVALLEQSSNEGGWVPIGDCAIPADGCTSQIDIGTLSSTGSLLKTIRFTNNGGSNLKVTKSKPPVGTVLGATNPSTDLSEGLAIPPGTKSSATVYFQPGSAPLNSDAVVYSGAWTLNTDDLTFGVHVLNFTGTLAPPRVGPLLSSGLAQFKYLGCFQDSTASRIESTAFNNVNNSNGLCQQQAVGANFPFAGTEFQTQCFVGYTIPPSSLRVDDSKCTTYTCPGDTTQFCGGNGGFISLYYDSTKYNPSIGGFIGNYAPPSASPRIGNYQYAGCYTDNAGARTLNGGNVGNAKTNSLESCAAACKGTTYFGAEFATECFCGNSLLNSPTLQPDSQCTMLCPGNGSEICGAGSRLTLYALNGTIKSTSSSITVSSTISSFPVSSTSSSTSNSASPTPTGVPFIPPTIGNYQYVECHSDNTTIRTLQGRFVGASSMTIETCAGLCTGFTYFGLEYSTQCYCGNALSFGSFNTTDGRCNMLCGGNPNELCGGPNGLTLYRLTAQSTSSSQLSSTTSSRLVGSSSQTVSSQNISTTISSVTSLTSLSSQSTTTSSQIESNTSLTSTGSVLSSVSSQSSSTAISSIQSSGSLSSSGSTGSQSSLAPTSSDSNSTSSSTTSSSSGSVSSTGISQSPLTTDSSSVPFTSVSPISSATLSSQTVTSSSISSSSLNSDNGTSVTSSTALSSVSSETGTSFSTTSSSLDSASSTNLTSSTILSSVSSQTSLSSISSETLSSLLFSTSSQTSSSSDSSTATLTGVSSLSIKSTQISPTSTSSQASSGSTTTESSSQSSSQSSSLTSSQSLSQSSSQSSQATTLQVTSVTISSSTSITSPTSSASPWSYAGCANDTSANRALNSLSTYGTTMTIEACQSYCLTRHYPLAGLENGNQCFCDLALNNNSTVGRTGCITPCVGNSSEVCGGSQRLSVYNYTTFVYPKAVLSAGSYNLAGCVVDSSVKRVLSGYSFTSTTSMTVENCIGTCQGKGFSKAGLEFAQQCYCGNTLTTNATAPIGDCKAQFCTGDSTEFCGGPSRLLLYST